MNQIDITVMDYETALTDGTPSLDYYRDDFRVLSAAFAWREDGVIKTVYCVGEDEVRIMLAMLKARGAKLCVHNAQFEYGVTRARVPGHEDMVQIDTMRMAQVTDNGGREAYYELAQQEGQTYEAQLDALESKKVKEEKPEETQYTKGLSLVACMSRFLPTEPNHKQKYYDLIRMRTGCKRGKEGKNLNALTPDELQGYNIGDAVNQLKLYEVLKAKFETDKFNWQFDHTLYMGSARDIAESKHEGIPVDRPHYEALAVQIEKELADINAAFRARFGKEIEEIEALAHDAFISGNKTLKGQNSRRQMLLDNPEEYQFNVGSNKQLAKLFVSKLGMAPKFWTSESKKSKAKREADPSLPPFKPSPSFRAAHLKSYGDGGELLIKRRKRMLVLTQTKSLLELSAYDGKWHIDLKACGTATGRFAGGRM